MNRSESRAGFTLIELSVVIGIVAIIMTMGATIGQDAIEFSKRYATQSRLTSIETALDSFVDKYGFLPCPADRTFIPGSDATFGEQECTVGGGVIEVTHADGDVLIGMLPVRALQLPDSYASDAWGGKLLYAVSKNLAVDTFTGTQKPTLYVNNDANINIRSGDPAATNYPLTADTDAATYVVVSHGESNAGAFDYRDTTRLTSCDSSVADGENCDDDRIFYDNFYNDGATAQFFDDFVIWGSKL